MALIEASTITKVYHLEGVDVTALDRVSLTIDQGEFVCIMGASGSGKSTFMNILGCLDKPTSGRYLLEGTDIADLDRDGLATIRNLRIGFVFQGFNLLSRVSAVENVELPLLYNGVPARERRTRALAALESVGLRGRESHRPSQLSGGEQQRVAIARALVNKAPIILADEPTGNLDSKMSYELMDLLVKLNADAHITLVVVTHEPDIAAYGRRTIRFRDGRVMSDERQEPRAANTGGFAGGQEGLTAPKRPGGVRRGS